MTVHAASGTGSNAIRAESDSINTSASLPPMSIMFLDQVDAHAEATVRFSIPSDNESFLKLAHEYRTPENLGGKPSNNSHLYVQNAIPGAFSEQALNFTSKIALNGDPNFDVGSSSLSTSLRYPPIWELQGICQ